MKRRNKLFTTLAIILGITVICSAVRSISKTGTEKDKLWLHRTLSLEKMKEKENRYPNVEVDVVWRFNSHDSTNNQNSGYFDVTHDVDVSYGLKLDTLLMESRRRKSKIWIDFKNLDESNKNQALRELNKITSGIPHANVIVESPQWHLLKPFKNAGYQTSCYITPKRKSLDSQQTRAFLDSIANIVEPSGCVTAISFNKEWYKPMSSKLKDKDIDLLTWSHHTDEWQFWMLPESYIMDSDPQLKVILIRSKATKSENR